jgi:hypothetical protein
MLLSFVTIENILSKLVPPLLTWHIFQIIVDCLSHVMSACVLNQSNNHWLLSYVLEYAITICLKCREEVINPPNQIRLMDDNDDNMLCFMLDPRFKRFHLRFSFLGCEKRVSIIEEYDGQSLYPMLLKCYHYLHPMT